MSKIRKKMYLFFHLPSIIITMGVIIYVLAQEHFTQKTTDEPLKLNAIFQATAI